MKPLINDFIMVFLAIVSIGLLIYDFTATNAVKNQQLIHTIDLIIACVFLVEFLFHFTRAKDKKVFFRKRWWELLAAIPISTTTTQFLRTLKIVRIIPLLESLRFVRLAVRLRLLLDASQYFTHHAYPIYAATIAFSVITLGALGFHYFEYGTNPHVKTFFDSVWWAIVTTTTIGYGDIYPITVGGRVVAIFLIFTGISALGAFIAAVDAYFVNKNKKEILEKITETIEEKG